MAKLTAASFQNLKVWCNPSFQLRTLRDRLSRKRKPLKKSRSHPFHPMELGFPLLTSVGSKSRASPLGPLVTSFALRNSDTLPILHVDKAQSRRSLVEHFYSNKCKILPIDQE